MGAQIILNINREITINGVDKLHGVVYRIIGDRIEAASWACLAAATNGRITVKGIEPYVMANFTN